jgi:hypothetical protein
MIMKDESNDMTPEEFRKNIPASLDQQLRALLGDGGASPFKEELPAAFLKDAREGLEQVKDEKQLEDVLKKLNLQMHLQLTHHKKNRKRKNVENMTWTYWAILLILLLVIVGFILVRMTLKH